MHEVADSELYNAIGRVEGKVDLLLSQRLEDAEERRALEGRVRALENWKWLVMGGASVLGLVAGFLSRLLGK